MPVRISPRHRCQLDLIVNPALRRI